MSTSFCSRGNTDLSAFTQQDFINEYEKSYFLQSDHSEYYIPRVSINSKKVEEIAEKILYNGIQNKKEVLFLLAWKIGGIDHKKSEGENREYEHITIDNVHFYESWGEKKGSFAAGHFSCPKEKFENFCKAIAGIAQEYRDSKTDKQVLKEIITAKASGGIEKFGPVYVLTLLYYITKNRSPIFDQYAYRAIRAIYHEKKPDEIWYAGPSYKPKNDSENDNDYIEQVANYTLNVINDYKWYLKEVFGTWSIRRDVDRALWVYGHPQSIRRNNN